ncbi:hypothetical protein EYF80_060995 [Liparis tanakae]|uniref:Uncharacterized protein n=1 Tax=Liparis tanakae TaxID=230148 RepID=A0A4Z2EJB6_9TELE|nr:hypothetical protein EYF80_060995 [Liparis tanakae]
MLSDIILSLLAYGVWSATLPPPQDFIDEHVVVVDGDLLTQLLFEGQGDGVGLSLGVSDAALQKKSDLQSKRYVVTLNHVTSACFAALKAAMVRGLLQIWLTLKCKCRVTRNSVKCVSVVVTVEEETIATSFLCVLPVAKH